ncbi:hypothetical protein AXF42_Ash001877 [Apostasia shenzhenica]|uniref:Uncharacterized protein n=1 Tax=Apostasia shenzhenica TaxID=1088818 RepID=A0A2I0ABL1_9ASPA|nr:hypothetical protein AXF42_Ash001877 [Apostasia shenzhenica]
MKFIASSAVYKSLRSYWRRRRYRRLENEQSEKKMTVARPGGGGGRRRRWRSWKVAVARPVLRLRLVGRVFMPRSLLARLRDVYMNMMLAFARGESLPAKKGGGGPVWVRRVPRSRQASLRTGNFEKRMMTHIYNSVIATR